MLVAIHRFEPTLERRRDLAVLDYDTAVSAHEAAKLSQWLSEISRRQCSLSSFLLLPRLTPCEEEGEPGGDAYGHHVGNKVSNASGHDSMLGVGTDILGRGALEEAALRPVSSRRVGPLALQPPAPGRTLTGRISTLYLPTGGGDQRCVTFTSIRVGGGSGNAWFFT